MKVKRKLVKTQCRLFFGIISQLNDNILTVAIGDAIAKENQQLRQKNTLLVHNS